MIINRSGITLRVRVADIGVFGRATQGVRIINLSARGDEVASVCCVDTDPEEEAVEAVENPEVLEGEPEDNTLDTDDDVVADDETEDEGATEADE